jgi:hypothetical protein
LLAEVFAKKIAEANTLSGVTPENIQEKRGILQGLEIARGILQRKEHTE